MYTCDATRARPPMTRLTFFFRATRRLSTALCPLAWHLEPALTKNWTQPWKPSFVFSPSLSDRRFEIGFQNFLFLADSELTACISTLVWDELPHYLLNQRLFCPMEGEG